MIRLFRRSSRQKSTEIRQEILWQKLLKMKLPFGADYLRFKLGWGLELGTVAIEEYRKFLFMALISKVEVTPSQIVDEVWHYHILHTQAYLKFSEEVGRFLHHNPGTLTEQPRFDNQYLKTLRFYTLIFNAAPPTSVWPGQDPSFCSGILSQAIVSETV